MLCIRECMHCVCIIPHLVNGLHCRFVRLYRRCGLQAICVYLLYFNPTVLSFFLSLSPGFGLCVLYWMIHWMFVYLSVCWFDCLFHFISFHFSFLFVYLFFGSNTLPRVPLTNQQQQQQEKENERKDPQPYTYCTLQWIKRRLTMCKCGKQSQTAQQNVSNQNS